MKHRLTAIAMAGALLGTFAIAPISAVVAKQTNKQVVAQVQRPTSLRNMPVEGTLSDGGTYKGTVSVTSFGNKPGTRELLVSGVLNGTATLQNGTNINLSQVPFRDVPATLKKGASAKQAGACDILFLDIGPIFLDLLGLTVDLSQIVLDINAVPGSGNLLGNLLCALVGLLDGPGSLTTILQILEQINNLLGSL